MPDLLDITDKVASVMVVGLGLVEPVEAYTDGTHYYFSDPMIGRLGAHISGLLDLSGRPVSIERSGIGWQEQRGRQSRQLHRRHIGGVAHFRFDDEWLFTVVAPPQRRQPAALN